MDELIAQLTAKLGIDSGVAESASQKAMAMVKEHAGDDLFAKISAAIPGADQAAAASVSETPAEGGGGMLGKLASMASSKLAGDAGGGLEMGAALASAGIQTDQIGGFVTTIIDFIRDKAGDQVMDQVLDKFPMLKTLMG